MVKMSFKQTLFMDSLDEKREIFPIKLPDTASFKVPPFCNSLKIAEIKAKVLSRR